jgi:hypothetical protein
MVEVVILQCGTTEVTLLSTGASIKDVKVPDSSGRVDDVVLGHPHLKDYKVAPLMQAHTEIPHLKHTYIFFPRTFTNSFIGIGIVSATRYYHF